MLSRAIAGSLRMGLLLLMVVMTGIPVLAQGDVANDARLKEIDDYVRRMREEWQVPGLAVAIVKDDAVVFAKGYGVRKLGEAAPVDERTIFAIASNTKAVTAAALALLVDEGKLRWDDPVSKYLPYFQLSDPYVTRELRIRDLLSHRSGLGTFSGDLLWYETNYDRAEILRRTRFLKPVSSFRSRYGYQNIMFIAAGQVVAAVTGQSWDEFVKERFFTPLGMNSTSTSITALKNFDNVATPHNEVDGKMRVIRYGNVDGAAAAAGINSSVADLAQWLRLQLGRGKYQDRQFFSVANSREMWSPHIMMPVSEREEKFYPTRHFRGYGLGWELSDYQGRKLVMHGGALDGMISRVGMVPEENLGIVILSNSETQLPLMVMFKIVDIYLNGPKRDWGGEMLARIKEGQARERDEQEKLLAARRTDTRPSLGLAEYTGSYQSELYGAVTVTEEQGKLVLRLKPAANLVGELEHWQFDTYRIKWRDTVAYPFPPGFVTFQLNRLGKIDEIKIEQPNPDFDFGELELKKK